MELNDFLQRVNVRRAELRLKTLRDLADAAGINQTTIHNFWKSNRKAFPYADDAVRMARALKTTVEYLVTGENPGHDMMTPDQRRLCRILEDLSPGELEQLEAFARGMKVKTAVGEVPRERHAANQ